IHEGPLFHVGKVQFAGNTAYDSQKLVSSIELKAGEPYTPQLREDSLTKLRDLYGEKGYNNPEIQYNLSRNTDAGVVDVDFKIAEGRQAVVADIKVTGNEGTSEKFVRNQLEIAPGNYLNLKALSRSRRNLYSTGAYTLVDIDRSLSDQS